MDYPIPDDDPGRAAHIHVFANPGPGRPRYQIRIGDNHPEGYLPQLYRWRRSALVAAMHLAGGYPNGAVIHLYDVDGEYLGAEVHRPIRIVLRSCRQALRQRFPFVSFLAALGASLYLIHTNDIAFDPDKSALAEPIAAALGYTLITLSILISVGVATALAVGLDHRKSWPLRREIIMRSIAFVAMATVTIPAIAVLSMATDELLVTTLVAVAAATILYCLIGILRVTVSIYCYAIDTAENG